MDDLNQIRHRQTLLETGIFRNVLQKKESGMQQQCVCSAFPKETMFLDHIMCEYACIPLQSFEIPGHLVQLWQRKKKN